MPHLDPHERILRGYVGEQSREARIAADRAENAARIREQVEVDPPPGAGCKRCGDPYVRTSALNENGECDLCVRDAWVNSAKEKLGPEELYPEHFPERENRDDE